MSRRPATRSALGNVFVPLSDFGKASGAVRPARPVAKAAVFAANPLRRVMIAKIHIAKKDLDFDDGDYRALLERVTGKVSTTAMSDKQLDQVLGELARLGWKPSVKAGGKPRPVRAADHPGAKKARAMLISLGLLGVIRNTSEAALEAFARRQMGDKPLQWADQSQVYKLIEALKAIAERNGWPQSTEGLADPIWTLKYRLCAAILRRLVAEGVLAPETTLASLIAERLLITGPVQELAEKDLEQLAAWLGGRLATHAAKSHYEA